MDPNELSGWGKAVDRVLGWAERGASRVAGLLSGHRSTKPQRVVASQPVANPDVFEGRGTDIGRLGELLESRNVVWITGAPGIGKSALAGKLLRDRGTADDACSFELGERARLQDLLESISAFLAEKDYPAFGQALRQPGLQPVQRIPALLRALEQTEVVLLIESYEEVVAEAEIGELLQQAEERLSGARIIVTSQEPPGWEIAQRRLHLGGLEAEESRLVLAALALTDDWQKIHEAVDGCPKGLRVAAGLAKRCGVGVALKAAARGDHPALGLFGEVYGRMAEPGRRMWVMLAMLPGPFDKATALALWGDDNGAFAWSELAELSVLDARGEAWQMHSLARATGSRRRAGQGRWQKQYGQKIAGFYADFAAAKRDDRDAIEAELENVLAAARLAFEYGEWDALRGMGGALGEKLNRWGRWAACAELLSLCYEKAKAAKKNEVRGEFAYYLGIVLRGRGMTDQAEVYLRESLILSSNLVGQAKALHELGKIATDRGQSGVAEELLRKSFRLKSAIQDWGAASYSQGQLGILARDQGEFLQARRAFGGVIVVARRTEDSLSQAIAWEELGVTATLQGRYEEARRKVCRALVVFRRAQDSQKQAAALRQLGIIADYRMRPRLAALLFGRSLRILPEPVCAQAANTLWAMALLAEKQGDSGLAEERMGKAVAMMEEMGMPQAGQARGDLERLRKLQEK